MTQTELVALLGRPLTANEVTNLTLYIDISKQTLEQMTCLDLSNCDDERIYDARHGYTTVFTDLFTDVTEVKINDTIVDESAYSVRQWNRRRGSWYNSIVFGYAFSSSDEVTVSANWICATKLPNDLKALMAGLFDLITKKNKYDATIQSKQVEDFRITMRAEADLDADFQTKYGTTLRNYSQCSVANIQHGGVC